MADDSAASQMARRLVLATLSGTSAPDGTQIRTSVEEILPIVHSRFTDAQVDKEALIRRIETECNVWVEMPSTLSDPRGHIEWLTARRREETSWNFWNRYRRFLEDYKDLSPNAVINLNEVTDMVLGLLEDPKRPGPWDQRGMVVGQVQSGKTSNYIGLICKAADAGYRLIVVLAGVHNSLRSQTQLRLDEGFLGFDTQKRMLFDQTNVRIGVGQMPGAGLFIAHALTNSADDGDFRLAFARGAGVMVGGSDPVVLVVKKYKSVLDNLIKYATAVNMQQHPTTGALIVRDVPMLVIDDEADHASVNTAPEAAEDAEEVEPKAINRLIRKLLASFDKSAYVGYTATPFANIFIRPPDPDTGRYGEDLFPRSFIVSLKAPSNYLGPAQVFGLPEDWRAGTEAKSGLPVVRDVSDYAAWMPDKHRRTLEPGVLPGSLVRALRSFILACAARASRGQGSAHNSMLIHVTRFVDVQERVVAAVQAEVEDLRRRIIFGDGASGKSILHDLEALWKDDFVPTSRKMPEVGQTMTTWEEVLVHLSQAVKRVTIRKINGRADDVLEYYGHPEGISVIAIGGDKLSRGLTLEGLTVSYYLRASKMYDTLMQMGRWFGYRPGYADLCRLYTTPELRKWYEHIALADAELRREFDYMRLLGNKTPLEYGLRVRSHPDALMVTSRAKMRNHEIMRLSFAGTISETVVFHRQSDNQTLSENWAAGERLMSGLTVKDAGAAKHSTLVWDDVPSEQILRFFRDYKTHESATKAQSKYIADYIEAQGRYGELITWAVALVSSGAPGAVPRRVGRYQVGMVERGEYGTTQEDSHIAIKRLVNPPDEMLDLTPSERRRAMTLTSERFESGESRSRRSQPPSAPDGLAVRTARPAQRGLLLLYPVGITNSQAGPSGENVTTIAYQALGIAVSFPRSETAQTIEYAVNNTYWEQEVASL
jgi:hypothetical protein